MNHPLPVTVVVAARNEADNLPKCLEALKSAQRVIVVDSQSTDGTAEIAMQNGAEARQFRYQGGSLRKRQWALDTCGIETPWTLLIDADEVVPDILWREIEREIRKSDAHAGYLIYKSFHFLNQRFRFGGFSHAAVLLFQTGKARFETILADPPREQDMEVHERVIVDGPIGRLRASIVHEDFKGLDRYVERHREYAVWEARVREQFLATGRWGADSIEPRLLGDIQQFRRLLKSIAIRVPCEPMLWFLYHYVFRLGILEGYRGYLASRLRAEYIADVRRQVRRLRRDRSRHHRASF